MMVRSSREAKTVSLMVLTEVPKSIFKSHKKETNCSILEVSSGEIASSFETISKSISDSTNCSFLPKPPTATKAKLGKVSSSK